MYKRVLAFKFSFLHHIKLLHYKYKRLYIKVKYFIQGPLFKAYSYMLFLSFSILIGYQIYNRLIKVRLPVDLNDPISNMQLGIYSYILFINMYLLLILLIYKIKTIWGNPDNIGYLAVLAYKIELIFVTKILLPISRTYLKLIYSTIPMHYERFLIAVFIFFNNFSQTTKVTYFYGILILPKLIVLIFFLIDVYNELFYYFYKVLWLLLLPLLLRFLYYVFRLLYDYAFDRIIEEMNASPEAPGPLTDEQIENIVAHAEEHLKPTLNALVEEQKQRIISVWYIQLYYRIKSDISTFKYNVTPKMTSAEIYTYNIRTSCLLHSLRDIIILFDSIKDKTYFYLNVIIRGGYILGWFVVILKQLT